MSGVKFTEQYISMKKYSFNVLVVLTLLMTPVFASAATGPVMDKLKITYMYTDSSIYIAFESGALPGCYQDKGARLYSDHVLFDQLYSQVLTMSAIGGIKGQVIYEEISGGSGWSTCRILGFALQPSPV